MLAICIVLLSAIPLLVYKQASNSSCYSVLMYNLTITDDEGSTLRQNDTITGTQYTAEGLQLMEGDYVNITLTAITTCGTSEETQMSKYIGHNIA